MKKLQISSSRRYEVLIGGSLRHESGELIKSIHRKCTAVIVTDDMVEGLHAAEVAASLQKSGFDVRLCSFQNGEKSKNISTVSDIVEFFADNSLTRSDLVIALGGGVVGDLAGFAAASYLRGVEFVQMPTTLLAAIDSSVGGKTGCNLSAGKNLMGAFWQPSLVICDTDTLKTLPSENFRDGTAEAVKYGILSSRPLFERFFTKICPHSCDEIIEECIAIKARYVERDERDTGDRRYLNLGHTIGHAVEKLSGYKISHGAAVAIGMAKIARAAQKLHMCDESCVEEIERALAAQGLSTQCPYFARELSEAALCDKKREARLMTLVYPKKIGECGLFEVGVDELENIFELALGEK
ncbi:MAG: 3-dehydroquinate synthase [Oscillospiraceae bacterium]